MAGLVRHRQTKEPETDRPHLNHRATSRLYLLAKSVRPNNLRRRTLQPDEPENLFLDVQRHLTAWSVLRELGVPLEIPAAPDLPALAARLHALLASQWSDRWLKAVNKKRRSHVPKPYDRTHGSVFRILKPAAPKPAR